MKSLTTALLLALPISLIAACAANVRDVQVDDTGGGGDSSSAGGGSASDAGSDASMVPDATVSCDGAMDCAAFNGVCTVGACVNGLCTKLNANEYGSCDDGLYCTDDDTCVGGACVGGTTKFCPSLDSCHLGVCDEALKTCKNIPGNDGAQCEDGDPCTQSGVCMAGACSKGPPISCAFYNSQCSVGVCDPVVGCKALPNNEGVACDNGSFDGCSFGICQQGLCASVPQNDGQPCDDGLFCTINDKCVAAKCSGDPNPCAPPDNPCMVGVCNEFNFSCVTVPGNNGMACEDGNFCTGGEVCSNGMCLGGQPANEGIACDDANGCTGGTTCASGTCSNPVSQIGQCVAGDACCPAGCTLNNDADCLYWVPGVQQNVDPALLSGWTQCWSGTYADSQPALSTILTQCDKGKLLMACRPVGAANFTLLAMAPRADVLFDCGTQSNCTKQSNGVGWYYDESYSWGFAPGGLPVNRNSCDYNDGSQILPEQRLCWHTGGNNINSGYRCGSNDLNGAAGWQRVVYEAD